VVGVDVSSIQWHKEITMYNDPLEKSDQEHAEDMGLTIEEFMGEPRKSKLKPPVMSNFFGTDSDAKLLRQLAENGRIGGVRIG
jgi:hypothetical protein